MAYSSMLHVAGGEGGSIRHDDGTSRLYGLPTGMRAGARGGDDDRRYHGQAGRTWVT